jgi:hypothetical protein
VSGVFLYHTFYYFFDSDSSSLLLLVQEGWHHTTALDALFQPPCLHQYRHTVVARLLDEATKLLRDKEALGRE